MTVTTTGGDGTVVPYDPDQYGDVGLEDVGVNDVVIPRLRIVHDEAEFEDNLSKARYKTLDVILLGLVKQRIMWDDEIGEGDRPQCKSPDFDHGFPQVDPAVKAEKQFPWDKSNFNPADFPATAGINGLVTLPCNSCIFKEWEKGDWKVPPCMEQHTYPLLYTPDEGETWTPALLSLQKTGIKPSRSYISSFAQSKTPMFTVKTRLDLTLQSRGSVRFSVPNLRRMEPTDRSLWGAYAENYRSIREYVRQAPRPDEEEGLGGTTGASAPVPETTPAAASAPATAPVASATASPAPAATSAPAAATPAPAPASPSAPETAAAPPAPASASPAATSAATGEEDLPF